MNLNDKRRKFVFSTIPAIAGSLLLSQFRSLISSEKTVLRITYHANSPQEMQAFIAHSSRSSQLSDLKNNFKKNRSYSNTSKLDTSGTQLTSIHFFNSEKDMNEFIEITKSPEFPGRRDRQAMNIKRVREFMSLSEYHLLLV